MAKETFQKSVNIVNRKASHDYHFVDKYVAGIVLTGTEIKSVRQSKVNMQEAFCFFDDDDSLMIKQMHISPYTNGTYNNHQADRERKLLLTKKELKKLLSKSEEKGLTIIPTRLFINDKGLAKLEIALARGKKLYDKREDIKTRDTQRELDRAGY
jgi:SsrA-binding protein